MEKEAEKGKRGNIKRRGKVSENEDGLGFGWRLHMWPLPHYSSTHSPLTLPLPLPLPLPSSLFPLYDGRRISIGDCALFKPPQDAPPFIGIIRNVTTDEEGNNLKLGVNWLYRPSDVKLRKGILLEAAPNEVFYSFHKDEIPAASLLHPCKVAFLRKGVELPSGISAFVCRRVYDIENKCLWWLTDKDYINERQEEINSLLEKTRLEMHGAVPSGGRSPKTLSSPTSTTQSKPSSESVQNSSSFSSQGKGKKREQVDQGRDSSKRERLSKPEDGESGCIGTEQLLKSEIAKITEKGGLIDFEGVDKLVQLMQSDGVDKKINLANRIMLVDVIAVTDSFDCLGGFLEVRGLPVLDEWLQDVREGKIGGNGIPRDGDKSVDEFLLAVLRALDKLPINLQALQTCNVGKSVNHLRTHKNSKIQKKARNLVDTWKKRVEAQMKLDDTKSESSRGASWSSKPVPSEVSHVGSRKFGLSSEDAVKSPTAQSSASKGSKIKHGVGDRLSKLSPSPGSMKSNNMSAGGNLKDLNVGMLVTAGSSDPSLTPIKEERSSSSSHSQNNSQSCSSDHAKTAASSCGEDAKSSTTGSVTVSKRSSGSQQRKSANIVNRATLSEGHKDPGLGKARSLNKNEISEKASPTIVQRDKSHYVPTVEHVNTQRLIIRLPNTSCSSSRVAYAGGIEESEVSRHKASPPADNLDNRDKTVRVNTEHPQSTDVSCTNYIDQVKDGLRDSDNDIVPTVCAEKRNHNEGGQKIMELAKATQSILGPYPRLGKPYEGSLSSMNALVESCVKFSEARSSPFPDDDVGMNLLATVAAGEITKSGSSSPSALLERNSPVIDESSSENEGKLRLTGEETSHVQCQLDDRAGVGTTVEQSDSYDKLKGKNELKHASLPVSTISTGYDKGTSLEIDKQNQTSASVQLTGGDIGLKSTEKPDELRADASVAQSTTHVKSKRNIEIEEANSSAVVQSEPAAEGEKVQKEENGKLCFSSLEPGNGKQNTMNERVDCDVLTQQKASPLTKVRNDNKSDCINTPTAASNLMLVETNGETCYNSKCFGLSVDHNGAYCQDILKMVDGLSVSHVDLKLNAAFESERVMLQTSDGHLPVSAAGSGMTRKFDFDLNKGIPSDDGSQEEPVKLSVSGISSSVHLSCPLPNPISSISGSFSTSITVAAAAKGSFVPPVNLLRTAEERGWKGSAATSAFRPAEPKRTLDIHASIVMDKIPSKQHRPPLDFDLNETSVEDVPSQGCPQASGSECMAHDSGKGGLDLDLNRIDEVSNVGLGVFSAFKNSAPEAPELPSRLSLPFELSCGFNNASRGFDLNDGPVVDEVGPRTALPSNPFKVNLKFPSPIPGVRMNGSEFGNFSWFPVPNSYPAITVPSILSGRGDQYVAAAAGSQRILAPNSGTSYGSEMFRGPVLSSSAALPFSTASPFQYPGFPFETNFPLPANTFSAASTGYFDSSTSGPLRFPNISPQLIGSAGLVSSSYHRPYMMNIPGGASNVASKNRNGEVNLI